MKQKNSLLFRSHACQFQYQLLLYRHRSVLLDFTTRFMLNYIRDLSDVFFISSPEKISMTSFSSVCLNNRKKITRWLQDIARYEFVLFSSVKTIVTTQKIKFKSSRCLVTSIATRICGGRIFKLKSIFFSTENYGTSEQLRQPLVE